MEVDANAESCLQTEAHSRMSRVSDWRERARVSWLEFDSGESESEKLVTTVGLAKRIEDFGTEMKNRLLLSFNGLGELSIAFLVFRLCVFASYPFETMEAKETVYEWHRHVVWK